MRESSTPRVRPGTRKDIVTGTARYVDDVRLDRLLHMAVVRSTQAHARLHKVRTAEALATGGVVAVFTADDLRDRIDPIPPFLNPAAFGGRKVDVWPLAADVVRYVGEPIAVVVAEDALTAAAAARSVRGAYEVLPHVYAGADAVRDDAPQLYEQDGWPTNVIMHRRTLNGPVDEVFRDAPHVVRETFEIQRYTATPLEPRGYVAEWTDDGSSDGRLTLYAGCQNPHQLRWTVARTLRMPEESVRVVVPTVGGSFGLKMHGHPEEALVCFVSRACRRPVKWIESREECLLVGGREQTHDTEVAFDDRGVILALRDAIVVPVGAVSATVGWGMAGVSAATLPTAYRVDVVDVDLRVVATNKPPWNATRGFGKEAAVLIMERLIDLVARSLNLDPLEVRRRNLLTPNELPHRLPSGYAIDSGDFPRLLELAADRADYHGLRRRQSELSTEDRVIGVGVAFEITPEGGGHQGKLHETQLGNTDTASVRLCPSGAVEVLTGVTSPGNGNDLGIAKLVAAELGLSREQVSVLQGDTDRGPYGYGNNSSKGLTIGGAAAVLAARDLAGQLRRAASLVLQEDEQRITLLDGLASTPDGRSVGMARLYGVLHASPPHPGGPWASEFTRTYRPRQTEIVGEETAYPSTYPYVSSAAYVAVVAVDPGTGVVELDRLVVADDCGVVVDEQHVVGQLHGAVAMGLGGALYEHSSFDASGRLVANDFKSYLVPRATDMPQLEVTHLGTPSPNTLLGTKGAGEAGIGGAMAATANAVEDALNRFSNARVRTFPLTPPRVLELIAQGTEAG